MPTWILPALLFIAAATRGTIQSAESPGKSKENLLEAGKVREFSKVDWSKRSIKESAHYHLETNLPEDTQRYLVALLEAVYRFYSQEMGRAPSEKLNAFVYAQMDEFGVEMREKFKHALRPGEGGAFVNHQDAKKRGLYVPWVVTRSGLEPSVIVIHESFHQFYHALFNTGEPVWFNEAMATYYETAEFDGERIVAAAKISPSKLKGMQELFKQGKAESLAAMMRTTRGKFIGPQYCEAWSFFYWMMWGERDKIKRAEGAKRISTFLRAVHDPKNHTPEAFERIVGIKLSDVEPQWKLFVESLDPGDPWGGLGDPTARR